VVPQSFCHFRSAQQWKLNMKRKKSDIVQLSKIRIREELRRKLASDAEDHAKTLNGEIVDRLEKSYRASEFNKMFMDAAARASAAGSDYRQKTEEIRRLEETLKQRLEQLGPDSEKILSAAKMVDVLLGGNRFKSELLRSIAIELANLPDELFWSNHRQLVERAFAQFEKAHGGPAP
jgi:hypothetical protein